MNFEIFKLPDPSGRLSKESFVSKNFKEEYDYIIEYSISNNIENLSFKEKVYLCLNNLSSQICNNPDCINKVKFINSSLGYRKYCSNKCISSDPEIKKQKQLKSLEKWGTNTPAESDQIKQKIISTNIKKYGVNSPMCLEENKQKSKQTLHKNWQVDNPSKSKEIMEKRINSFKLNSHKFKESYKKTSLSKFGTNHPWSNRSIHQKTIDHFYKSFKERIINKINDNAEFIDFNKGDKTKLIFLCKECNSEFEILTYQFYWRNNNKKKLCTICHPISESYSMIEKEVFDFIRENYQFEILSNNRTELSPYEIDIYLPELRIGLEFNGVFWHSDKFKDRDYHQFKYNLARKNDISLLTIWEDDWNIKKEICKSFILNKLSLSKKIYARKCSLKIVSYNDSREFLESNHLQGDCKSSVRIGLFLQNELISLMTFSKLRLPLGGKSKDGYWELTRFCNKLNCTVVGGASKLLNHFISSFEPSQIQTFSDNMISNGDLYEKLGFRYSHTSKPGYWYVINGIRQHRFNFRKQKLILNGGDPNKFEHEIMEEMGYHRVWSSGNKKWILNLK